MAVVSTFKNETKTISLKRSELDNGEYLLYKLKVWGEKGTFAIVDEKDRFILKSTDYPYPQQNYLQRWPRTRADIPEEKDLIYTLVVSFNEATKYSYVVEHHKADGSLPVILKDIEYSSNNAKDSDYNTLRILLK